MCISISWGEAEGEGVVPGFEICLSCCAGDACESADGELEGSGSPGMCVWGEAAGAGAAVGDGITIPGVCSVWPGAVGIPVGLADSVPRRGDFRFALGFTFRFGAAFGFDFGLFMPGML
ncbi:MAG: hypothetical protein M3410_01565 [Acidobacteriota bacterium]|nr:hypothetical protein [Acidobacteriota bacterium]